MTDNKLDPRDTFEYLHNVSVARHYTAQSMRHSARAHQIAGNGDDAMTYLRLAGTYEEISARYREKAYAAADCPMKRQVAP